MPIPPKHHAPVFSCCLVAFLLFIGGCDTAAPELDSDVPDVQMAFGGALQASFAADAIIASQASIVALDPAAHAYRLDVSLLARSEQGPRAEEGQLVFHLPFQSADGTLAPGAYLMHLEAPEGTVSLDVGQGAYSLVEGNTRRSQYAFYGTALSLKVQPSVAGRVAARFTLTLAQQAGTRHEAGVAETVTLVGDASLTGTFDLVAERRGNE